MCNDINFVRCDIPGFAKISCGVILRLKDLHVSRDCYASNNCKKIGDGSKPFNVKGGYIQYSLICRNTCSIRK